MKRKYATTRERKNITDILLEIILIPAVATEVHEN